MPGPGASENPLLSGRQHPADRLVSLSTSATRRALCKSGIRNAVRHRGSRAMTTIAGHSFVETFGGRACSSCGRSWIAIAGSTEDDIGALGIAHVGKLSKEEFDEIVAERSRIWAAVGEVARGAL